MQIYLGLEKLITGGGGLVCHGLPWSAIVCLGLIYSALAAAGLPLATFIFKTHSQEVQKVVLQQGCPGDIPST